MPRLFGREIPLWIALLNAVVYLAGAFVWHWSADQEATLCAVVASLFGLITALMVHDGIAAMVLGLAKALMFAALGFGLHLDAARQAVLMTFVAAAVAAFVRTQATSPVPPLTAPPR